METVRITWAQEGSSQRRESGVTFSAAAAEDYKSPEEETEDGVSDVRIVPATMFPGK
jgi:hypothetical protein